MLDAERVIGASTAEANAARFERLPAALPAVMGGLYRSANLAAGMGVISPGFGQGYGNVYGLTRESGYTPPEGYEFVTVANSVEDLALQYHDSEEELLVVGGATIWGLFQPYASQIDIAEASELVPGDVVYDAWETSGDFSLQSEEAWEGGRTLHYVRG